MKRKKRIFILVVMVLMVMGISMQAQADLNLLGQGTSTHGTYNLIYDTDLDITWYDYTRTEDTWDNQMAWANALSVTFGSNTYTDWRLPTIKDTGTPGCNVSFGGTDCGFNVDTQTGEMAHLFHDELWNQSYYDTTGTYRGDGNWGLQNVGDFQNLQANIYWSGTEYAPFTYSAWFFDTNFGVQYDYVKVSNFYAVAVRPGLAVAPEPTSMVLFATGGVVMAGRMKMRRRRNR